MTFAPLPKVQVVNKCINPYFALSIFLAIPDPCDKNPCLNGGTCVSNLHYGMSYHWCQCPETEDKHVFYGINCELRKYTQSVYTGCPNKMLTPFDSELLYYSKHNNTCYFKNV